MHRRFFFLWYTQCACLMAGGTLSVAAQSSPAVYPPGIEGVEQRLASLEAMVMSQAAEVAQLKDKLRHFSREGNEINITGANLNILSGAGPGYVQDGVWTPGAVNGLGNLVIGYNESRALFESNVMMSRVGSHNLVVGPLHEYLSNGGFLAGVSGTVSGPHGTVAGGFENQATGFGAMVAGGTGNVAGGDAAAILGGSTNQASGSFAVVTGGFSNSALADYTTVSGGSFNAAAGQGASLSGGHYNAASGEFSSVTGGYANTATGSFSVISGGGGNIANGGGSVISGGMDRETKGEMDWAGGGFFQDF